MYVKLADEGRALRDPVTRRLLPPEGAELPETEFWLKCVNQGDLVVADPPQPADAAAKPPKGKAAADTAGA
ncbi:DUF2635 domain-containing protein [Roseomonas elaeocarpi]|uniref:DUF2635 domain-containing protein n=1 Tax=Roseomonas elaeocarpi TaxID=907779 RepID=A0ABV6JQD0_9PROT